ncbi:hypothetical protein BSKO_05682 [Bryopsis sp. KO-2023]|nr:hypothetical protein BSKO_05682 [Bryopsis sp. KO-2023]
MYTTKLLPSAVAPPKAFAAPTDRPSSSRRPRSVAPGRPRDLSRWLESSHRLMKCMAVSPTTPDANVQPLPSHEIFEEGQVVRIDDRECIVFSAVDVVDRIGTVVFLSGFAQTPEAYTSLLERCAAAGVVALVPMTSTTATSKSRLQSNLLDDGAFWMEHVINNSSSELQPYLPQGDAPVGILGHSMGGGMTYSLAALFPQAKSIVTMAPTPALTEGFEPAEVIASEKFQASKRRVLVLAGGLDPYAKARDIKREIVTPLTTAFGEGTVDYEFTRLGLHTMYQDFIDFPLEDIVGGIYKEDDSREAFLTTLEEFPGLLAGRLFLSGLRFELALAAIAYAYGVVSEKPWLEWGCGFAVVSTLLIAGIVELIKNATGQPEAVSERVAKFFVDEF